MKTKTPYTPQKRPCGFKSFILSVCFVFLLEMAASVEAQTPLTYENWAQGFFTQNCLGCHHTKLVGENRFGAPSSINFDSLPLIRRFAGLIRVVATGEDAYMPPAGVTWWWDRVSLKEWLDAGLPGSVDSLSSVPVNRKVISLAYTSGYMGFSNPIEDVFNHRYFGFYPDHIEDFTGTITERYADIVRLEDGQVVINNFEWFERNKDWSKTTTRMIDFTPPIPVLLHGPEMQGEVWSTTVTVRERFWKGWAGKPPTWENTRQENWQVVNEGLELVDNGVIHPELALKISQRNLSSDTQITWWFGKGLGLIRRETNAPSAAYIREITREMNIITEQWALHGPHLIDSATQEWLPMVGRWHSEENPNYNYWADMEVQRLAVVDASVDPSPTPTQTLFSAPTSTPVIPTPTSTLFPPGLPSPQPTPTRTQTPTATEVIIPPTPTLSPTLNPDDPHLSDYNGDQKVDVSDLLFFLRHWHSEME